MAAPASLADRTETAERPQVINCPNCEAPLAFKRNRAPRIDSCGFESYSLECTECAVALAGIIDPCDETLLLSIVPG
ncbi:MAG TPA: hypothetical protein VK430_08370 [Xanthobacteraceae bacterium]|nr:hypothetical protein [Xanthobacteraceae bacterium]